MNTELELPKPMVQENDVVQALLRLCAALKHLQSAQSTVVAVLRPTHDKKLVSEASAFSEACADELDALREELGARGVGTPV